MGRKILNRKDLRADFDAAERRKGDDEEKEKEEEEEEEGDEDDDEEGDEEEGDEEESDEEDSESGDDDDEDKPKKKKKKKPVKPVKAPAKPKSRTRTPKVVRMRQVWGVFSNNNQCVATYDYPKRKDADAHAVRLSTEKRSTFFVQPVKEAIEEKKEK